MDEDPAAEEALTLEEAFERRQMGTLPPRPPKTAEEAIERDLVEDMMGVPGSRMTPSARVQLTSLLQMLRSHERDCQER